MKSLPACLALLLAALTAAHANPEMLPTVTTEMKRDGSVLPYARINELLTKLRQHGEGLFRMDFKVDTEKTKPALADIRMAVRSDDADYPLRIDAEGRFDLPLLPEAEARTADLATNAAKGQMAVHGTLELTVPPEQLDMAQVRRIVRVARTLREELLPWYLRWLFPRIEAVRVCSATPGWKLEWRENGQLLGLPLPLAAGERDPDAGKGEKGRPCALLTGQESWPDAARLVAPAGSKLSVKLQGS
ncbi:hypothetical protein [Pelomonas aquatica]|jgi:hypothetical protein|uniref:DUF2987 domain-containing protein n=1 Tax=Pelomonas aquatica TaxID=431058 RepID=A0A9X4LJS6_9BURK|nr:hypothetical protein [Pelomonas aquatica]MCY4755622.1 hypothetical protein [Pelomonas aquatica]MDG0862165.1 hypothetical protein [Pelomonas aquatica]